MSGSGSCKEGEAAISKNRVAARNAGFIASARPITSGLTLIQYREGFFSQREISSVDEFLTIDAATELARWHSWHGRSNRLGKVFQPHLLL